MKKRQKGGIRIEEKDSFNGYPVDCLDLDIGDVQDFQR
jgi:hypothetical protein